MFAFRFSGPGGVNLKTATTKILLTFALLLIGVTPPTPYTPHILTASSAWPTILLSPITSGLQSPTYLTNAGDNSGRIFILEQPGRIRILKNGNLLPTPFLDISSRVKFSGEEGLLGLAFPPNYANKGYFYIYYTMLSGDNVVARFTITSDPDIANPDSESQIILLPHPKTVTNHNGGQLAFGPDGYLYIGVGDGGGAGDPFHNSQNLGSLLAKILRIDVELASPAITRRVSQAPANFSLYFPILYNTPLQPYWSPSTNPFVNQAGALPEIWAYGLRNPWRFSFDSQTGDLYIADVGQDLYEEVNFQPAGDKGGENYGWNIMEGFHCYNSSACNQTGLTMPVIEYSHGINDSIGCAIIGGYVYRGPANPSMQGIYFYGDYCSNRIWGLKNSGGVWETSELNRVAGSASTQTIGSFGTDQAGNLYLTDVNGGAVYQITAP